MNFSERKFLLLPKKQQNKLAFNALLQLSQNRPSFYRKMEELLKLRPVQLDQESLSCRYHFHAKLADLSLNEHDLLIKKGDHPSNTPYLPIAIYLDDLRSAHNVGSILRTTEAFRLGTLHFSAKTPFIDNKKVQDAAMGTADQVPCIRGNANLPTPLIALETVEGAPSLFDFSFPEKFTLVLGNEEFGVSQKMLSRCCAAVQIPLVGSKNSLNVANAFAIAAAQIFSYTKK